MIPKRVKK